MKRSRRHQAVQARRLKEALPSGSGRDESHRGARLRPPEGPHRALSGLEYTIDSSPVKVEVVVSTTWWTRSSPSSAPRPRPAPSATASLRLPLARAIPYPHRREGGRGHLIDLLRASRVIGRRRRAPAAGCERDARRRAWAGPTPAEARCWSRCCRACWRSCGGAGLGHGAEHLERLAAPVDRAPSSAP